MRDMPDVDNVTLEQVAALRQSIADLFEIHDMQLNKPRRGQVRFIGRMLRDPADHFGELQRRFRRHEFTPLLRKEDGQTVLLALPGVIEPAPSRPLVNIVLLLATIASTLFAGAANEPQFTGTELWLGIPFSASIMLILGAHELGHYFAARYHKVDVTLPYFLPMPLSLIGTLGAFIRMRSPTINRRALLDVGAAGPLAGLLFAIPILIYGLATSEVGPLPAGGGYLLEGNSLLYAGLKILLFGRMLPGGGLDVTLNQMAWAGWVGLLVTGLNLMPVAQLDGGHIVYTLFGKLAKYTYWPILAGLVVLGLTSANGLQWGIWVILLLLVGNRHAEPLDTVTELDPGRRLIAILCLVIFVLVFIPMPLTMVPAGGLAG